MGLPLTDIPLPTANFLRMQYFPAEITGLPTTPPTTDKKVIVTDGHLVIITTSPSGFVVWFVGVLDSYDGFNYKTRAWELTLETGEKISISRSNSCGCGSRLRSYNPYPNLKIYR